MNKTLLSLLVVILAGCGGGGGSSGGEEEAAVQPRAVLVEAYGDSTRHLATRTPADPISPTATELAQDALRSIGLDVLIANEGVSSTSAVQLLSGTDGKHHPWDQQMAESRAAIVSINHAINDNATGETLANYTDTMRTLVKIAQRAGKKVMIETANPVTFQTYDAQGLQERITAAKAVAVETGAYLCDINAVFTAPGVDLSVYITDGYHPNLAGHALKAPAFTACIRSLL